MGIRSTLTTDHYSLKFPKWLGDKYTWLRLPDGNNGPLNSNREIKIYSLDEFYLDVQQVLKDNDWYPTLSFNLTWLSEDRTIHVVEIYIDKVVIHDEHCF